MANTMNEKVTVKKLVSLNPKRYKILSLNEASFLYAHYILNCVGESYDDYEFKTFKAWLETEI